MAKKEPRFTKEVLVKSKTFKDKRDLVSAILEDGVEYTVAEAEKEIEKFMKGKVK
jgi:arginine repressor